jgi:hypothetical protein
MFKECHFIFIFIFVDLRKHHTLKSKNTQHNIYIYEVGEGSNPRLTRWRMWNASLGQMHSGIESG